MPIGNNVVLYPIVAPALVLVGVMMMESVRHIRWDDYTESIPAFLTLVTMPLAVSITDGIAFGFISSALLKVATGRSARAVLARLRVRGVVRDSLRDGVGSVGWRRGPWQTSAVPYSSPLGS